MFRKRQQTHTACIGLELTYRRLQLLSESSNRHGYPMGPHWLMFLQTQTAESSLYLRHLEPSTAHRYLIEEGR